MKKYNMMLISYDEDIDDDVYLIYTFNKKRLFKIIQKELKISNPKKFLKEEYTSEDTSLIIDEFLLRGWNFSQATK